MGFSMRQWLFATLGVFCALGAAAARADDDFRAGLTLRAGFGGTREQDWVPHLVASFGSGPQFLAQSHSTEAHCLMTAGNLALSGAVSAGSACEDAPLVQFDLHQGGLGAANLLGLNLLKASSVIDATTHSDLLSGNSEWVDWTLKQHTAGTLDLVAPESRLIVPTIRVK
jgi:hypothetical protein